MTTDELKSQVDDHIALTDDQVDSFVSRLIDLFRAGTRQLLAKLKSNDPSAIDAAKAVGGFETALKKLGLLDKISTVSRLFDAQLRQIREAFRLSGQGGITFSAIDQNVVQTLVTFETAAIETRASLAADSIKSAVMRSVILGQPTTIEALEKQAIAPLESSVKTDLNTGMAGFNRAVTFNRAAKYGMEYFAYMGPLDKVTRPFCREHVNKVFTRTEIEAMPDQQGLPVMLYGGGYNCRHRWQPISEALAKEIAERQSTEAS